MSKLIAAIRGYLFILKCMIFNKNARIGQGLKLYKKLEICGQGKVNIGKNCIVSGIRGDSKQYVTLYTHSPEAVISVGENANLYAARISAKYEITIGDDVLLEECGIVDTAFHSIDKDRQARLDENQEKCKIHIGDRVSVGAKSFLLKGITVGDDVIVAPGSIVSNSIPAKSFVIGNPAKCQE